MKLMLKAEYSSRGEAAGVLKAPGDAVLIIRGAPRWLLLKCPCGCGDEIPVNLDARAGKAWRLYRGASTGVTLFPSVWRDTGCESHFIIWRDHILLFGQDRNTDRSLYEDLDLSILSKRLLASWPKGQFVSFLEMADQLGEIPWDVQEACRELARAGQMIEGRKEQKGMFLRP